MFNVLFASDDNFASYLGVAIYSLLKHNNKDFEQINIFILEKNISLENKNKIEDISKNFKNSQIFFITDKGIENIIGNEVTANRALSSFSRLFAPSVLPEKINKVLYLDCDSLITGSFKELWTMDIENYACAGVLDGGPEYNKTSVGLTVESTYINAGVLLINLNKWRKDNIEKKFIDFLKNNDYNVYNNDQGIINGVLSNEILLVHPRYNLLSPFLEVSYEEVLMWNDIPEYYTKEILDDAIKNPVFIHFVQFLYGRPWYIETNHPSKKLYENYANETPFKDNIFIHDNRALKYRIFFSLINFLPYKALYWIYKPYKDYLIKYF